MRLVLVSSLLLACGCQTAAPRPTPGPAPDGAILSRMPCPTLGDPDTFEAALKDYFEEDIVKAGLAAELQATPLTTLVTFDEAQRLSRNAADRRCERVVYASGGLEVTGFVLRPEGPGPHPVALWVRGGTAEFGRIEAVTLLTLQAFADAGYVVVATQYRGVDGGEGADELGGAEVEDVLHLVPLARGIPGADPDRLSVIAGSRGVMEAVLALRRGLPARAAAFRAGLYDVHDLYARRPDMAAQFARRVPGFSADPEAALHFRTALAHVDAVRIPILLLHGRQDWRVPLAQSEAFAAALAAHGRPHRLIVYEREEHQLVFHRRAWIDETLAWFAAHGAFPAR